MKLPAEVHTKLKSKLSGMQDDRRPWWDHWRDLADYYLPRRYVRLLSAKERVNSLGRNAKILDGTGGLAARTLANGMMNGITSPARPWFKLKIKGVEDDVNHPARVWLDDVERRILGVMAASNFYNGMATLYGDLAVFGTGAMLIYESDTKTIHCYNPALGEYYVAQDYELRVNNFAREFWLKVHQVVDKYGIENVSPTVKSAFEKGGSALMQDVAISVLIEPNLEADREGVAQSLAFRETTWETNGPLGTVLARKGYNEFLAVVPRWSILGNDAYGTGPAMDALGDVIQLQHETKKKAQGLDKMMSPPVIADVSLEHKPTALFPNGITYANMRNSPRPLAEPIYTVDPPIAAMTMDIRDIQARIRETFHNELFTMISQLDTVRSAAEIDARKEEKLVQLGPVLERFENECLDPAIKRIYAIMARKGLIPPPPEDILQSGLTIEYTSILAAAQAAVGTAGTERWLQVGGNLVGVWPEVRDVPNIVEVYRDYGRDVGVPSKNIRSSDEVAALVAQRNQEAAQQQQLAQAGGAAQIGQTLSQTEVGGGRNALQELIGG